MARLAGRAPGNGEAAVSKGRIVLWTLLGLGLAAAIAVALGFVPRWPLETTETAVAAEPAPPPATPKIRARLFYVSDDGLQLVPVEREVPFGGNTIEQARCIVEAQLESPPPPLVSPIPAGTKLRALYVSARAEAFVDLSREAASAGTGGALDEILAVYSVVNAVTANLPAIRAVQILVDGHEVDTLAGHVDLRRPLASSAVWVQEAGSPAVTPEPAASPATPAQPGPQQAPAPPRDAPRPGPGKL